jgi:hypothetical protein
VSTAGDSFADLIDKEGLGRTVAERDVDALALALEAVLFDEDAATEARANVARVRQSFTWDKAMAPLMEFCRTPLRAADRGGRRSPSASHTAHGGAVVVPRRAKTWGLRHDLGRAVHYARVVDKVAERRDRARRRAE